MIPESIKNKLDWGWKQLVGSVEAEECMNGKEKLINTVGPYLGFGDAPYTPDQLKQIEECIRRGREKFSKPPFPEREKVMKAGEEEAS